MNRAGLFVIMAFAFLIIAGCPSRQDAVIPSEEGADINVGGWSADVEGEPAAEEWVEQALNESDPAYCLKLPANERDDCILPISNDSLSNCLQIVEYGKRRQCLFHHAYESGNISICDLMDGLDSEECIEELSPPCTFVLVENERGRCLAFAYMNYTYCRDDECFMDYAFAFGDREACSRMNSSAKAEGCRSAVSHTDGCKELEGSYKHLCYYIYALGEDNPTRCYYIDGSYDSQIAYDCFLHFAVEDDNPSLCSAVHLSKEWECYTAYALQSGNKEGCYAIDTRAPESREDCFRDFAYEYGDLLSCNEIDSEYVREICYSALIFGDDASLSFGECNGIFVPQWKDKCFQRLAELEEDILYCNYVEGAGVKANCLSYFD